MSVRTKLSATLAIIAIAATFLLLTASAWGLRTGATLLPDSPQAFFAAMPAGERVMPPVLKAVGGSVQTGEPLAALQPITVVTAPNAAVVFWTIDHGSFVENDHYVLKVTADAKGRAQATPRLGVSAGLYRVVAASDGATGSVAFYLTARSSAEVEGGAVVRDDPKISDFCNGDKEAGEKDCCDPTMGHALNTGGIQVDFGAYVHEVTDFEIDPRTATDCAECAAAPRPNGQTTLPLLRLRRDYSSRLLPHTNWFGRYWEVAFERRLAIFRTSSTTRIAYLHLGNNHYFVAEEKSGVWTETTITGDHSKSYAKLVEATPGAFRLTLIDGSRWEFALPPGTSPKDPSLHATVVAKVDRNGNRIDVLRDANGRATGLRDAYGQRLRFKWGHVPSTSVEVIVEVVRPDGHAIVYEYDAKLPELLRFVHYPGGEKAVYDRLRSSKDEQFIVFNDPRGNPGSRKHRVAVFDNDQQVFRVENPFGHTMATRANAGRDNIMVTLAGGSSYSKRWRDGHYLEALTTAGSARARFFQQGPHFQILKYTDEIGRSYLYSYDARGNRTWIKHPDSTTERRIYDAVHNGLLSFVDRLGRETSYTYDTAGNLLKKTYPDKAGESWTYNPRGQVLTATDRRGSVTRYAYDTRGYHRQTILPADKTTNVNPRWTYTYDTLGRVTVVTDPTKTTTQFQYDLQDRLVEVRYADGTTERTVYGSAGTNPDDPIGETGLPVRKKDRNDNWTEFDYDLNDRLVTTFRPDHSTIVRTYAPGSDQLVKIDDAGDVTVFRYDNRGRRIEVERRPDKFTVLIRKFVYDDQDRIVRETDPYGFFTKYEHDIDDNVKRIDRQVTPTQVVTELRNYDAAGNLRQATDGRGNVWEFTYDANDRLRFAYDPAPHQQLFREFRYDPNGNLLRQIDQKGHATIRTYTTRNMVATELDPSGVLSEFTYTLDDRMASRSVPRTGARTDFRYDCCGRVVWQRRHVDGGQRDIVERFAYDGNGNRTAHWDGERHLWRTKYDSRNRVAEKISPTLGATTFEYGEDAEVVAKGRFDPGQGSWVLRTDPEDVGQLTVFDGLKRIAIEEDALDNRTHIRHDVMSAGWPTRRNTDAERRLTVESLDALGRTRIRLDPLRHVSRWDYDGNGNLVRVLDPRKGVTGYRYDPRDLLVREVLPGPNGETRYEYDDAGRPLARIDPAGARTTYEWDAAGRLLARRYPDKLDDTFRYDDGGRLVAANSARYASQVRRAYDAADRLVRETQDGLPFAYFHDRNSRPIGIQYPSGFVLGHTFTDDGDLDRVGVPGAIVADYDYDRARRETRVRRLNGVVSTLRYDDRGTLESLRHVRGREDLQSFRYRRDRTAQITVAEDLTGQVRSETYGYDREVRLTDLRRGRLDTTGNIPAPTRRQEWSLDENGNWQSTTIDSVPVSREHNAGNQITKIGTQPVHHDRRGNCDDDGVSAYKFDIENRMVEGRRGTQTFRFRYDAFGRRIETLDVTATRRTRHLYDGWRIVEERGGSGVEALYVYGRWVDEPVAFVNASGIFFPQRDHRYSIALATNMMGGVAERYEYDAYGARTTFDRTWGDRRTRSRIGSPFGLSGLRRIDGLELLDARMRFYSPTLGRFLQRDPAGYIDGFNLYEFARSNPIERTDPLGLGVFDLRDKAPEKCPKGKPYGPKDGKCGSIKIRYTSRIAVLISGVTLTAKVGPEEYLFNQAEINAALQAYVKCVNDMFQDMLDDTIYDAGVWFTPILGPLFIPHTAYKYRKRQARCARDNPIPSCCFACKSTKTGGYISGWHGVSLD